MGAAFRGQRGGFRQAQSSPPERVAASGDREGGGSGVGTPVSAPGTRERRPASAFPSAPGLAPARLHLRRRSGLWALAGVGRASRGRLHGDRARRPTGPPAGVGRASPRPSPAETARPWAGPAEEGPRGDRGRRGRRGSRSGEALSQSRRPGPSLAVARAGPLWSGSAVRASCGDRALGRRPAGPHRGLRALWSQRAAWALSSPRPARVPHRTSLPPAPPQTHA